MFSLLLFASLLLSGASAASATAPTFSGGNSDGDSDVTFSCEDCVDRDEVFPVCASDGNNYDSPCLAGCVGAVIEKKERIYYLSCTCSNNTNECPFQTVVCTGPCPCGNVDGCGSRDCCPPVLFPERPSYCGNLQCNGPSCPKGK